MNRHRFLLCGNRTQRRKGRGYACYVISTSGLGATPSLHNFRDGIRKDVTYPIFCGEHDHKVFRALENPGFDSQSEQVLLLAYRALCYKTWNPHVKERLEFLFSFKENETVAEHERLFAMIPLLEARERLEQMLKTKDYTQLEHRIKALNIPPCVACTD